MEPRAARPKVTLGPLALALFSAVLVFLSYRDFNASFVGSFVAFGIALGALWLSKKWRGWLLLLCVPVFTIHGCHYQKKQLEAEFAPIIEGLSAYRDQHGVYPESLDAIGGRRPSCHNLAVPSPNYSTSEQGKKFCIICTTYGFNKHSYCKGDLVSGGWRDWD